MGCLAKQKPNQQPSGLTNTKMNIGWSNACGNYIVARDDDGGLVLHITEMSSIEEIASEIEYYLRSLGIKNVQTNDTRPQFED